MALHDGVLRHGVTVGIPWHAGIALVYHHISLYCGFRLKKIF